MHISWTICKCTTRAFAKVDSQVDIATTNLVLSNDISLAKNPQMLPTLIWVTAMQILIFSSTQGLLKWLLCERQKSAIDEDSFGAKKQHSW